MLMIPPIAHIMRADPTLPVASTTPFGEMKIPEPGVYNNNLYIVLEWGGGH